MSSSNGNVATCEKCGYPFAHVRDEYGVDYRNVLTHCGNCGHHVGEFYDHVVQKDTGLRIDNPASPGNAMGVLKCARCGGEAAIVRDAPLAIGPRLNVYCSNCGSWSRWKLNVSGEWKP